MPTKPNLTNKTIIENYDYFIGEESELTGNQIKAWEKLDNAQTLIDERNPEFFDLAIKQVEEAYELDNSLIITYEIVGEAYFNIKEFSKALPYLKYNAESPSASYNENVLYARCLMELKLFEEAKPILDKCKEFAEKYYDAEAVSEAIAWKAFLYIEMKDYDKAIKSAEEALENFPVGTAYNYLCWAYNDKGDYNNALKTANDGLKAFPDWPSLITNKANALSGLGKYREAIENYDYRMFINKDEQNLVVVSHKADTYFKWGKYNEAIECMNQLSEGFAKSKGLTLISTQIEGIQETLAKKAEVANLLASIMKISTVLDETDTSLDESKDSDSTEDAEIVHTGAGASVAPTKLSDDLSVHRAINTTLLSDDKSTKEATKHEILSSTAIQQGLGFLSNENPDSVDTASIIKALTMRLTELEGKVVMRDLEFEAKYNTIVADEKLYAYYKSFVSFCSSANVSAKSADGGMVGDKEMSGIPLLGLLSSLPLPALADTALGIINSGAVFYQSVQHNNKIARAVAISPTITDFEKMLKEVAVNITLSKSELIHETALTTKGVFGLLAKLNAIKDKFVENNYKTAPEKLGLQDAIKAVAYMQSGKFSETETGSKSDFISFVVSLEVESKFIELLDGGSKLRSSLEVAVGAASSSASGKQCLIMAVPELTYDDQKFVDSIVAKANLAASNPGMYNLYKLMGFPVSSEISNEGEVQATEALGVTGGNLAANDLDIGY